ncbi:MAG: DUF3540 domain-containing protein [Planctomycetota bacterium]
MTTELLGKEAALAASFLGPARALDVDGARVLVALPAAKAWATVALAGGYRPVRGDVLLVIGRDDAFYVIGVIAGRGATSVIAHGDLELMAPNGRIALVARDGVELRTGVVRVVAKAFEAVVDAIRQRCKEASTVVAGVLRTKAGRAETEVEDVCRTQAGRIVQHAQNDVSIDGEKIHLG